MHMTTRAPGRRRSTRWAAIGAVGALFAGCAGAPDTEPVDPAAVPTGDTDGATGGGTTDATGTGDDTATGDGTGTGDGTTGTGTDDGSASSSSSPEGTATGSTGTETGAAGLERFYGQELQWTECGDDECAQLEVPIDYEAPDGETIQIQVVRVPATGDRLGSILVNPGGPGASGVDYATSGFAVSSAVAERYDVVGFDPRGVAGSAPIECVGDEEMDTFVGADPSPDDAAEEAEVDALLQDFAASCDQNAGALLGHVSTVEAAKDMDVLRAALGEDTLTYLGASYGTFLGATYAELFPDKVGRMVLDGAVDPTMSGLDMGLGQAEGFERATRAYVEDCVADDDCPLGDDVETGLQRLRDFLTELDQDPLPVSGDAVEELTEGWGLLGIIVAMYDQAGWPILTSALEEAFEGDGSTLMFLANIYADRTSEGVYNGNGMQAIYAVNCLDRPAEEGGPSEEEVRAQFEEVSPTFGKYLAGEGACAYWPVEAQTVLDDYDAAGAAPILVIGTTRDPATPYEWAVSLAEVLESGVLISYDGDGHTAYGRSNTCVDDAVDAYLIEGTVSDDGLSC